MSDVIDRIREQFDRSGHLAYGETVSLREHMLQTAYVAEQRGADKELITASLLHDYGHLLAGLPEDIAARGVDGHHEALGADALKDHFPPRIIDAVRLHVAAKRYLCATRPGYLKRLSPASVESLALQGGPMSGEEIDRFENAAWHKDALRVRVYDDLGKETGMSHPGLGYYLAIARGCLL